MASAERILDLLDTETTISSPPRPRRIEGRLRGEIVFENVTFGYKPDEPVLRNVSFSIQPGQTVGVVGWTGMLYEGDLAPFAGGELSPFGPLEPPAS